MTQQLVIPTQVKIGVATYPVELVEDLVSVDPRNPDDGTTAWGDVDFFEPKIRLESKHIAPIRQLGTFFHELTHTVLHETGDRELCEDEPFIRRFSNMLTQVFVENGWRFAESASGAEKADDDIYEHEGAKYRKVARKASVGDLVLMVSSEGHEDWHVGEIHRVTYVNSGGTIHLRGKNKGAFNFEYVVLVPLEGGDSNAESSQ